MKNFTKKLAAFLILGAFAGINAAQATELYAAANVPVLRGSTESSVQLKGDVSITTRNNPVTLSLRDSDVSQVLRMFADKAGLNIILHPNIKDKNVTLDLVNVPLNSAFEMVMGISELTYVLDGNTIIIAPIDKADFSLAKQEMTIIPVKYLNAATVADFLNKNIYSANKPGITGKQIAVTNPATNELLIFGSKNEATIARKIIEKVDKRPERVSFTVKHTTPKEMANSICTVLLPNALGKTTGGAAGIPTGGAAGVMTGAADLVLNEGVVACSSGGTISAGSIGSLAMQNLSVVYYTQLGTVDVIGGSLQQMEMVKDFIAQTDKKQPQAYLEVALISLSESGRKDLENIWNVQTRFFSSAFDMNAGTGIIGYTSADEEGNVILNGPLMFSNSSGRWRALQQNPSHVMYFMKYVTENRKARVLSNPRILVTNGQDSVIDLTADYVKSVKSEVMANEGGIIGSVGIMRTYEISNDNGIKITVTPFISPEGYVTLNLQSDVADVAQQVEAIGPGGSKDVVATLLQRRSLDLKNVRVKDGEPLIIGGMLRESESKVVAKIPFLGDIPVIGTLFRSSSVTKDKQELVIMITPKIIQDTEDFAAREML